MEKLKYFHRPEMVFCIKKYARECKKIIYSETDRERSIAHWSQYDGQEIEHNIRGWQIKGTTVIVDPSWCVPAIEYEEGKR